MSNPIMSTTTDHPDKVADEYTCFAKADTVTVELIEPDIWTSKTGRQTIKGIRSYHHITAEIEGKLVERYVPAFSCDHKKKKKTLCVKSYLYPSHITTSHDAIPGTTEFSRRPPPSGRWANADPAIFRPSEVYAWSAGVNSEVNESGVGDVGSAAGQEGSAAGEEGSAAGEEGSGRRQGM